MIIRFSVKQDDFDCLIEHVAEEDGNARRALRNATRAEQSLDGLDEWRVACSPTDASSCAYALPDAVSDIRAALNSPQPKA